MDVNRALDAYLAGELSLEELRDALLAITLERDAPPLAHAIEYFMDEAATNRLTLAEMNEHLRELSASHAPLAV